MSYMLLIVEPRGQRRTRTEAEGRALYARMVEWGTSLKQRGKLIETNSLAEQATRLEVRNGRRNVIDGPFTEAKEFVGGFYLLNCDSREEALALAGECPAAEWATVEVRQTAPCYE
jgi:hypothetical protein